MVLAVVAASVVILTAGYILWTIQRVYLGPEYKGPHGEALTPMNGREIAIAVPLVVMAFVLGIYPWGLLSYTTPSTDKLADNLTAWTQRADAGCDIAWHDARLVQQCAVRTCVQATRDTRQGL